MFMRQFVFIIPALNGSFPSLSSVLLFVLIANLILNYGLYENTVEKRVLHSFPREAI